LIFSWTCFFLITLLYSSLFTFLAIKMLSIYYWLCDQVAYRTFNSPMLDGIVRYVLINSVQSSVFYHG
jgi:hypothetical protein